MFCKNCGIQNDDNNKYCTNCNTVLKEENVNPANNFQAQGNNQMYTQNYNPYGNVPNAPDQNMTVSDWLKVVLLPLIPCVGSLIYLVMLFVWAFGDSGKPSLKTYAKVQLIMMAVGIVLAIIIFASMGAFFTSFFNELSRQGVRF